VQLTVPLPARFLAQEPPDGPVEHQSVPRQVLLLVR
jgi:hypothetical protein